MIAMETASNLAVERWRGIVVAVGSAILVATIVVLELAQIRVAVDLEADMTEGGRYVVVAESDGLGSGIEANRCAALTHNPIVLAAGGFSEGARVVLDKAPGEVFRQRAMVGDMVKLLAPQMTPVGDLYFAVQAAERLGLATGTVVALGDGAGSATVSVVDMQARVPDPGPWAWTQTTLPSSLDQCWVEFAPFALPIAQEWVAAWLTHDEGSVVTRPLLADDRFRADPIDLFRSRPTRHAWLLVGMTISVLVSLIIWSRRSELALYRTVGASVGQVVIVFASPYVLLVLLGTLAGASAGAYVDAISARAEYLRLGESLLQAGLSFLVAVPLITIVVLGTARGDLSAHLRRRL